MKIQLPNEWSKLNQWQLTEIAYLIEQGRDQEDFTHLYVQIVQILLMKKNTPWNYLQMRKTLRNIPLSAFQEATQFIFQTPKLYTFPQIKGVLAPADRMGDCTIEQFSLCDTILYRYHSTKNQNEKKQYARQMVAVLYRITPSFDKTKLPNVAQITDKIPYKKALLVVFIFSTLRNYITDLYPTIFQKKHPQTPFANQHTPFSKIITMMAADELRLLGNLKECQKTLLYDFFNAFIESKKIHEIKAKALKQ